MKPIALIPVVGVAPTRHGIIPLHYHAAFTPHKLTLLLVNPNRTPTYSTRLVVGYGDVEELIVNLHAPNGLVLGHLRLMDETIAVPGHRRTRVRNGEEYTVHLNTDDFAPQDNTGWWAAHFAAGGQWM